MTLMKTIWWLAPPMAAVVRLITFYWSPEIPDIKYITYSEDIHEIVYLLQIYGDRFFERFASRTRCFVCHGTCVLPMRHGNLEHLSNCTDDLRHERKYQRQSPKLILILNISIGGFFWWQETNPSLPNNYLWDDNLSLKISLEHFLIDVNFYCCNECGTTIWFDSYWNVDWKRRSSPASFFVILAWSWSSKWSNSLFSFLR